MSGESSAKDDGVAAPALRQKLLSLVSVTPSFQQVRNNRQEPKRQNCLSRRYDPSDEQCV